MTSDRGTLLIRSTVRLPDLDSHKSRMHPRASSHNSWYGDRRGAGTRQHPQDGVEKGEGEEGAGGGGAGRGEENEEGRRRDARSFLISFRVREAVAR
jgi:hypothetical protein